MPPRDFQQVLKTPTAVFEEGLHFFRGRGMANATLTRLAADLDAAGIDYAVVGAIALNQHGYRRFTEDIDILLSREGLDVFQRQLVGRGYRLAFPDASRSFRSTGENVPIDVIVAGDYPGDGRPKPVRYPDPADAAVVIDGVKTVTLEKLIEFKLASGLTAPDRLRDLADVQELIRALALGSQFAERLDPSVREKFGELQRGVEAARTDRQL